MQGSGRCQGTGHCLRGLRTFANQLVEKQPLYFFVAGVQPGSAVFWTPSNGSQQHVQTAKTHHRPDTCWRQATAVKGPCSGVVWKGRGAEPTQLQSMKEGIRGRGSGWGCGGQRMHKGTGCVSLNWPSRFCGGHRLGEGGMRTRSDVEVIKFRGRVLSQSTQRDSC